MLACTDPHAQICDIYILASSLAPLRGQLGPTGPYLYGVITTFFLVSSHHALSMCEVSNNDTDGSHVTVCLLRESHVLPV